MDTQAGTEGKLASVLMASPSIATYVIGLDAAATAMDISSLSGLATAGGKPAATTAKYYPANSTASAQAAVDAIIADLLPAGGCDDSCYATGCPRLTDLCILGMCRPNPCAGVMCPTSSYCYTDGVSTGACVKACTARCPMGTRCRAGSCIAAPCSTYCPAGTVCDAGSRMCQPDPLCTGVLCKGTSRCSAGICVEDPCTLITCPSRTRCVPWEGSCEFDDGMTPPDMATGSPVDMAAGSPVDMAAGSSVDMAAGSPVDMCAGLADLSAPPVLPIDDAMDPAGQGCSTAPGSSSAASLFVLAALACAFGLLRRRRQPAA